LKTRICQAKDGIAEAVSLLEAGEPVALPTETVYGLAADALSPIACAKIFEAKGRPLCDPLIVHLPGNDWLERIAIPTPLAVALADAFWPGPLTLVLHRTALVPDLVTDGRDTVAVRQSAHPVFQEIVTAFGRPLAAPSANRFGRISPTTAHHVIAELEGRIPLIVDAGPCPHGIESTIVEVLEDRLRILRQGPVTADDLRAFAPLDDTPSGVSAPGGRKSHYAPHTRLLIEENPRPASDRHGLLAWSGNGKGFSHVERLSANGDLREAAANLYGAMRRLDAAGLELITAEPVPESGIGEAIMDRLRKASAR
jgi:L-threonylcarbamoyladenylate synthase